MVKDNLLFAVSNISQIYNKSGFLYFLYAILMTGCQKSALFVVRYQCYQRSPVALAAS